MPYIFPILTEAAHLQYIFQYLESCEPILSTSPLRASEILRFKGAYHSKYGKICALRVPRRLGAGPKPRISTPTTKKSKIVPK